MTAAFATLAFLIPAWIAIVALARTLEANGAAIAAALRGQSMLAAPRNVEVNLRRPAVRAVRPAPELRAAA